jgi:acyl-CoA thioesterase
MSATTGPGTVTKFDAVAEQTAASLPESARELATHGIKAALIAGETQYGFLGGLVNMRVEDADDGKAVLTMDVTPNALNGYGYVHGGMLFTLADYAMGATARTLVEKGASPVTLEAKANYVSNVKEGRLIARCEALHQGKRLITLETRIFSADSNELVMIVTGSFYIIRDDEGSD